ncbi:hypothetical protein SAMN05216215_1001116 [Saccharopolyspora shandongensis]|uniref:Uncharacterized protein n=1 Tax=Saccharopolyspora shandongensis TaxID=418495 RepID=A0A1H2QIN2_9PSEU|nr:hypothetical protein [Saccharopolyspora shandongensis]SDW07011.1 hypothetical protein SAMN05216215_1001116 [Saccharopolyspora shandongensis]
MRTTAKLVLAAAASTGLMLGAQGLASADESPFGQPQQEQQQPQQEEQQPQDEQQPQQESSPSEWALSGGWANMMGQ